MINSKIFFDLVFVSLYLFKFLKNLELSKLCRKKLWGSKNPENGLLKQVRLFLNETQPHPKYQNNNKNNTQMKMSEKLT